jgi:hypothetical protein
LTLDVDHRAQRLQEGAARARLLQRPQRPGDGLQVDAGVVAALAQLGAARGERADQARPRRQSQQGGRAGQGGAAQERADVVTEAAAGDQDQALGALGELVEELHRDATAERVADDRRPLDPDRRQQVADRRRVRPQRVVAPRRRCFAVAD